jgi:F-type H+-transporting ATPase subunit delta
MSLVARRYAKGIFAVAREEQSLEPTGADLERLAATAADPRIGAALANPLLSAPARKAVARTLSEQLQLRATTGRFLGLLADQRRLDQIASICEHYRRLLDEALGQVRVRITAALPLDPAHTQRLVEAFERLTAKRVLPSVQVDSDILGGVIVAVEGKVYDGSLRTQLARLAGAIAGDRSYL